MTEIENEIYVSTEPVDKMHSRVQAYTDKGLAFSKIVRNDTIEEAKKIAKARAEEYLANRTIA